MSLLIENKGKSVQMIPMAVFADSMKSSPVTAMHMIVLWFKIFSKASICRNKHAKMHRQTATAKFLVSLLFESTIILAKVTNEINKAAKVIAPRADW